MHISAPNDNDATFKSVSVTTVYTVSAYPGDRVYNTASDRADAFFFADELLDAGATGVVITREIVIEDDAA